MDACVDDNRVTAPPRPKSLELHLEELTLNSDEATPQVETNGNHLDNGRLQPESSEQWINGPEENTFQKLEDDDDALFEVLAEFLSAVMAREYENALKYCKLILQYEPDNETVMEFYPLIQAKLQIENDRMRIEEEDDEQYSQWETAQDKPGYESEERTSEDATSDCFSSANEGECPSALESCDEDTPQEDQQQSLECT